MSHIITRFPPSPTGHLHIGGARTALFNWLFARQNGGKFILRIEDTDRERSKDEYTESILDSMTWLGLDWDEGPSFQSQRTDIYREQIDRLVEEGKAYWCQCQPEELDVKRQLAMAEGRKPKYDGTCRDLCLKPSDKGVVRLRAPQTGQTAFMDLIKGPISFENEELDDLIILRSDGSPTYHLAVVVDDVTMGVTHVIRGDDHVNNTPRQILIFNALNYPLPKFAHVPMILGSDKTRLSKRHGATSVLAYREMGYLPEALLNYLARLGWAFGDEEIFGRDDLLEKFSLENIGRSAGVFNPEKLLWLNAHWIKETPAERLAESLKPFLQKLGIVADDDRYIAGAIRTLQPRSKTLVEMAEAAVFYFREVEFDPKAVEKYLTQDAAAILKDLADRLKTLSSWTEKAMEPVFLGLMDHFGVKLGAIAQPLRVALSGKTVSPGIFEVMEVLGRERVLSRIEAAIRLAEGR